jgi:hypothetical protein
MGKAQFPSVFNWQTTSPVTGFLPGPGPNQDVAGNSPKSGVLAGVISGTNTIYTNILGLRQSDNQGIEVAWTGNTTGTLSVMVSNSGINFYALTYNPAIVQPAGTAGGLCDREYRNSFPVLLSPIHQRFGLRNHYGLQPV